MNILETETAQRHDGKWNLWAKVIDYDNIYSYIDEDGLRQSNIATKWIVIGVYDLLMEIVD